MQKRKELPLWHKRAKMRREQGQNHVAHMAGKMADKAENHMRQQGEDLQPSEYDVDTCPPGKF
jgi:hypothetical protein